MKFGKLEIHNFMSYKEAEIDLSVPGLFMVEGEVIGSKSFDSNGAGKSNLFEALTWVLFGKTIKEVSADDVVNNSVKRDCLVSIDVIANDNIYRIIRTRRHKSFGNSLKMFDESSEFTGHSGDVTQDFIDNLLGIDYRSFINSVIFGQGNITRFAMASDRVRKEILEQLLNLDYLPQSLKNINLALKKLNEKLVVTKTNLDGAGRLSELLEEQIGWAQSARHIFRMRKYLKIIEQIDEILELEQPEQELIDSVIPFEDDRTINEARRMVKRNKGEYKKAKEDFKGLKDYSSRIEELNIGINTCRRAMDRFTEDRKSIKYSVDKKCPTCRQTISDDKAKKLLSNIDSNLKNEREVYNKFVKELNGLMHKQEQYNNAKKEVERVVRAQNNALINLAEIEHEILERERRKERLINTTKTIVKSYRDGLFIVLGDEFISDVNLNELENKYRMTELEIRQLEEEINELEVDIDMHEFWKKAFSNTGLKAMIIDSVIPKLNESAQLYSGILTDGSINIEFINEKKLKGGGTRDKLEVRCSKVGGGLSYKGISGGEKKRTDICQALALRDLVSSRGAASIQFLFLDEIFESLDATGIERAVSLLKEMSKESDTIYVSTHIPGLRDQFDNRIVVVNEGGESKIA